jgi:excisionase family DNA binding protein
VANHAGITSLEHPPVSERILLTEDEAAARLGVTKRAVQTLRYTGQLTYLHVAGKVRVHPDDLDRYVEMSRRSSHDNPTNPTRVAVSDRVQARPVHPRKTGSDLRQRWRETLT